MKSPPTPKRIRLTITVSPEVHEAYRYMADVTGRSMGMEMGEWLDATLLAAVSMTERMALVRNAPREAVKRINELTAALESVERVRVGTAGEEFGVGGQAAAERTAGRRGSIPPPSNTGGKPPKQHQRAAGSK